jgi:hypothetical protein
MKTLICVCDCGSVCKFQIVSAHRRSGKFVSSQKHIQDCRAYPVQNLYSFLVCRALSTFLVVDFGIESDRSKHEQDARRSEKCLEPGEPSPIAKSESPALTEAPAICLSLEELTDRTVCSSEASILTQAPDLCSGSPNIGSTGKLINI